MSSIVSTEIDGTKHVKFTRPEDVSLGTKAHWDPLSILVDYDGLQSQFEEKGYYFYGTPDNKEGGEVKLSFSKPLKQSPKEAREYWAKFNAEYQKPVDEE